MRVSRGGATVVVTMAATPEEEQTTTGSAANTANNSSQQAEQPASASLSSSSDTSSTSVFEVINVLSSYTANHERLKVLRVSLSVIRFLSILNFVYTILGGTFLLLALWRDWTPQVTDTQRQQFFKIGLFVSIFAPLATCVDLMALRGLHTWRRGYLLPWLVLYGFVDVILFSHALSGIFHFGFRWTYLVLLLCVFCLYSAWRHLRRQYLEMLLEPPSCRTIEQLANDIRSVEQQYSANRVRENDLPPKYEDLVHNLNEEEDAQLPRYSEAAPQDPVPGTSEASNTVRRPE